MICPNCLYETDGILIDTQFKFQCININCKMVFDLEIIKEPLKFINVKEFYKLKDEGEN